MAFILVGSKNMDYEGLMTHIVVWLGTTCFTVWCVGQGTADKFLKQFWSNAGPSGAISPKGIEELLQSYEGEYKRAEVPGPPELHCSDLFYVCFCIGFLWLVEEGGRVQVLGWLRKSSSERIQEALDSRAHLGGTTVRLIMLSVLQFNCISVLLLRTLYQH